MCGVTGIWDVNANRDELHRLVERMAEQLKHRGPNDAGTWVDADAGVGLGHRRLSIIDLSQAGHQPMVSKSGRYVLAYNGEVYNFRELRKELPVASQDFSGDSDTEILLAAIEAWGVERAIERFIGMFAFALWDRRERELVLVRDRLGIKPMYWSLIGGRLIFGSELKAMRAYGPWSPQINRDALAAFMRWNYVPAPHSIYSNVYKLAPGTLLRMRQGGEPDVRQWWNIHEVAHRAQSEPLALDDREAVDMLEAELGDAVDRRLVSDVPLGAFLSGGLDSSIVVALMQSRRHEPVKTFTIGFNDPNFDEAVHARAIAEHLGTEHTELYVDPDDARDVIPRLPLIYDEPFADSSQLPTFLVSEMTRKHVTVTLSGDGGDELFAGYARYHQAAAIWRQAGWIPSSLRRAGGRVIEAVPSVAWQAAACLLPTNRRPDRIAERARKLGTYLAQGDADAIYRRQHTHWVEPDTVVIDGHDRPGSLIESDLQDAFPDFVERMQLYDTATYLPDDILTKVDRASMAVNLEVRVPMLDHRVVRLAWSLPRHLRHRGRENKWLLRQVLSRHVPQHLFDRPKKGFSVPIARWLRGSLRDWAEHLLDENRLEQDGYFEPRPIRKAWEDFLAGRSAAQEPIWGVLMFQAWLDEWRPAA